MHGVCVGACARVHVCGHQRTKFQSWLSPSAFVWILGMEHRSTGMSCKPACTYVTVFETFDRISQHHPAFSLGPIVKGMISILFLELRTREWGFASLEVVVGHRGPAFPLEGVLVIPCQCEHHWLGQLYLLLMDR